jgi:hypothetical protein
MNSNARFNAFVKEVSAAFHQRKKVDVLSSVKQIAKLNDCSYTTLCQFWKECFIIKFFIVSMKRFGVISNTKVRIT